MLETVKMLLGISDESSDGILQFLVDDATAYALSYCNLPELPTGLTNIVCQMAIDVFRAGDYGQPQQDGVVSSIKEGEESVNFAVQAKRPVPEIYQDYHNRLNAYRILR